MTLTSPPTPSHSEPAASALSRPTTEPRDTKAISLQVLALASIFLAGFAVLAAVFAVGLATRSLDEHNASPGAPSASSVPTVSLKEFMLGPSTITVAAGTKQIEVVNDGTMPHNLSIEGATSKTIDAGATTTLDITKLAPGQYKMTCAIPGHADAGMTGTLTVT